MRTRNREVNIFNMSLLDILTGMLGAFLFLMLGLVPYYMKTQKQQQQSPQTQSNNRNPGSSFTPTARPVLTVTAHWPGKNVLISTYLYGPDNTGGKGTSGVWYGYDPLDHRLVQGKMLNTSSSSAPTWQNNSAYAYGHQHFISAFIIHPPKNGTVKLDDYSHLFFTVEMLVTKEGADSKSTFTYCPIVSSVNVNATQAKLEHYYGAFSIDTTEDTTKTRLADQQSFVLKYIWQHSDPALPRGVTELPGVGKD